MRKSTLEQHIHDMSNLKELDELALKYANGGNFSVAMRAWMRAEELGDTKCRKNIAVMIMLGRVQGEEFRKGVELVKRWKEEGDADVLDVIKLYELCQN